MTQPLYSTTETPPTPENPILNINILGIRGIPARHGGFETFAERLALFLADNDWSVNVYCQNDLGDRRWRTDHWNGVRRIHVPVRSAGAIGTIEFDLLSTIHACREPSITLLLGYNTAVFHILQRLYNRRLVINMDGIEWRRDKWGWMAKQWLRANEWIATHLGHRLIADHPEIASHLARVNRNARTTMIPYGAVSDVQGDSSIIDELQLTGVPYFLSIARIEPENSLHTIVSAYAQLLRQYPALRNTRLVILGLFEPNRNKYHSKLAAEAPPQCLFVGPMYDKVDVHVLRKNATAYLHGHTVGGTNPSLVETLAVGTATIAHANVFNRWVAGKSAIYFEDVEGCSAAMARLLGDRGLQGEMQFQAAKRFSEAFRWEPVLEAYEQLLLEEAATPTQIRKHP